MKDTRRIFWESLFKLMNSVWFLGIVSSRKIISIKYYFVYKKLGLIVKMLALKDSKKEKAEDKGHSLIPFW